MSLLGIYPPPVNSMFGSRDMTIREALPANADALLRLATEFAESFVVDPVCFRESFRQCWRDSSSHMIVVIVKSSLVGYLPVASAPPFTFVILTSRSSRGARSWSANTVFPVQPERVHHVRGCFSHKGIKKPQLHYLYLHAMRKK